MWPVNLDVISWLGAFHVRNEVCAVAGREGGRGAGGAHTVPGSRWACHSPCERWADNTLHAAEGMSPALLMALPAAPQPTALHGLLLFIWAVCCAGVRACAALL